MCGLDSFDGDVSLLTVCHHHQRNVTIEGGGIGVILRERMESPFANQTGACVVRARGEGDLSRRIAWGTRYGDGTNVGLLRLDYLPLARSFLGEGVEE